jgi:archaemetzincin
MKRRRFLVVSGAAAATGAWFGTKWLPHDDHPPNQLRKWTRVAAPPSIGARGLTAQQIRPLKDRLVAVFEKKRPPLEGQWLDKHKEAGETFEQHLAARRTRMCDQYRTMYVAPLGQFSSAQEAVVRQTAEFMRRFFGLPVESLPPVSLDNLPKHARREHPRTKDPQVLSTHLLTEVLERRRPKDAVALLGLTASDLWPGEGWNFVFGQASLTARVGVWSIYRNGDPEKSADAKALFLRRTLKTAVHETGHMLGMPHCTSYECGMNGANHLEESDGQPLEFCPECQAKLWWTCGADPRRRVRELIEFAEQNLLQKDLPLWRAVSDRLPA